MSSTKLPEMLRRTGLTSYESEAYIALLSRKELTAEEISRITSVPITRVYGTLEQLMLKGFARIVETRPKQFHAISPEQAKREYLSYLRRNFESNILQIDNDLKSLQRQIEPMYVASHLQVKAEELLEPLDSLGSMENITREYLQRADEEILISTALFSWVPKIKVDLKRALKRGVKVKILMQITEDGLGREVSELISLGSVVRNTREPWHPVRGTLIDSENLIFVIWAAEESERYWNPIVYTPNHTKNQGLIRLFRESFLFRWNNAKRVQ
ncbi:MAG TPA: helix-turn-helix domain-containing protein [Candidatus Bathyarchaeia archaeon]|nr:helix-turn-helix domain-containing protein [Candidatus Bathyarchaeia archaeon]